MNQNGQLFSLDFLLAMGLVVLLLGTVISIGQRQAFEIHEASRRNELAQTGQHAVIALVTNPKTTCTLFANGTGTALETNVNNCLDWGKITGPTGLSIPDLAKEIGLPANYSFFIKTETQTIGTDPLDIPPAIFSQDFNAIISNGTVSKKELYRCIKKQGCTISSQAVSFKAWKT